MSTPNRYATAVSTNSDFDLAAEEAIQHVQMQLGEQTDLLFVFSAGHPPEKAERFSEHASKINPKHILGSNCMGVIGDAKEYYDGEPALVIWAGQMPQTRLTSFQLTYEQSMEGGAFSGWPTDDRVLSEECFLIALADPYSFPMDLLLNRLAEDRPHINVVGGMSSGSARPNDWNLYCGDKLKNSGATFVAFNGEYLPTPMVSQGCRPVGEPMIVTGCERNQINELGGRPAAEQLMALFDQLPTREKKQLNQGLHIGFAVTEYQDSFGYGDFLIRNVIGCDRNTGSISVGDFTRVGQTVQFHVRDHETAGIDLRQSCDQINERTDMPAQAALLFSCNGRGPNLFPEPHHDASTLGKHFGIENIAGFFAAGELGPIGGKNFLHGFTASAAIFS